MSNLLAEVSVVIDLLAGDIIIIVMILLLYYDLGTKFVYSWIWKVVILVVTDMTLYPGCTTDHA